MKCLVVSAALVALVVSGQASGDLVILKSGKTIDGIVSPREDTNSLEVIVPGGKIELSQDMVEEVLSEEEARLWKQDRERLQVRAEQQSSGAALEVLAKDEPVVPQRTLKDVGAQDQRFVLERLLQTPPQFEGNAAEFYWVCLDSDQFAVKRLSTVSGSGERRWNFKDPIFERMLRAASIKDCYFYPEYLPYPTGISPKTPKFWILQRVAEGVIALGRERIAQGDTEGGLRALEAALVMGIHLGQSAPNIGQFSVGCQMEVQASKALAAYYLEVNDLARYRLFNEYIGHKERELNLVRLTRQDFLYKFKAGKIGTLMDYARNGEYDLLQAHAMNYLILLKLAGEQQPLRRDILNEIPIEFSEPLKRVGPADSEEIAELFREIQRQSPNPFLKSHANQLLSMHPFELARAARVMLGE